MNSSVKTELEGMPQSMKFMNKGFEEFTLTMADVIKKKENN